MLHTHKKYGIMKTRTSAGACQTVGGWPAAERPEPSDYIETPAWGIRGKEGILLTAYEILSLSFLVEGIIITLLIALIQSTKK